MFYLFGMVIVALSLFALLWYLYSAVALEMENHKNDTIRKMKEQHQTDRSPSAYCIQAIDKTGGSISIKRDTADDCKKAARDTFYYANKSIVAMTLPYAIYESNKDPYLLDASIPPDWHKSLGEDIMNLYKNNEK